MGDAVRLMATTTTATSTSAGVARARAMTTPAGSAWHRRRAVLGTTTHAPTARTPSSLLQSRALGASLRTPRAPLSALWHAAAARASLRVAMVGALLLLLTRSRACARGWMGWMLTVAMGVPYVAVGVAAEMALERLRPIEGRRGMVLFALACASFLVLQSLLHAFVAYGSSLSVVCARAVLPGWTQVMPQMVVSLVSAPLYAWFVAEAQCSLVYVNAFGGVVNSVRVLAPRVVLLSVLPPLLACAPALVATALVTSSTMNVLWTVGCGMQCTAACLLMWNVLHTMRRLRARVSVAEARVMTAQLGKPGAVVSTQMMDALFAVSREHAQLASFVAFVDASGEAWRSTLHVLLAALTRVQTVLASQNASGKAALLVRSARGGGGGIGGVGGGGGGVTHATRLDDESVRQAVGACKSVGALFVKSYRVDVYGVVQRTLPGALVCVLRLKQEIALWLREPRAAQQGALSALRVDAWVGVASQRRLVEVVDDELNRCVYAIVARFDKFVRGLLSGRELEWDAAVNDCLAAFLRYDVP